MKAAILWDGRRNGPGGAYLLTAEHPRRLAPASSSTERNTSFPRAAIVAELARGPRTLAELSNATGKDHHGLNSALHVMKKEGQVIVVERRRRLAAGPAFESVYGLARHDT